MIDALSERDRETVLRFLIDVNDAYAKVQESLDQAAEAGA